MFGTGLLVEMQFYGQPYITTEKTPSYLQTHLALISANFMFQEKDTHFEIHVHFLGWDGKGRPTGKDACWGKDTHFLLEMKHKKQRHPLFEKTPKRHCFLQMDT